MRYLTLIFPLLACLLLSSAAQAKECALSANLENAEHPDMKAVDDCLARGDEIPKKWLEQNRYQGNISGTADYTVSGRCGIGQDGAAGGCQGFSDSPYMTSGRPNSNPNQPVGGSVEQPIVIPRTPSPTFVIPPLTCGGAIPLNLNTISIGANVKIGGAVAAGLSATLTNSLTTLCRDGVLNIFKTAINLVLPKSSGSTGTQVNNGTVTSPEGSVVILPPGMTVDMEANAGPLLFPDGGYFSPQAATPAAPAAPAPSTPSVRGDLEAAKDGQDGSETPVDNMVRIPPGASVSTAAGTLTVTLDAQATPYPVATFPLSIIPGTTTAGGGGVQIPAGTALPVQAGATVVTPTKP